MPDTLPQFAIALNANLGAAQPWRALVQGAKDSTILDEVGYIQADKRPIVVRFLKPLGNGIAPFAATDPFAGGGGAVVFGAKLQTALDSPTYLFACSAFALKNDGAGDIWYEGVVDLNTAELNAAFAGESEVAFTADIEIDTGVSNRITVAQFNGKVRRQIVDSTTSLPEVPQAGTYQLNNGRLEIWNQEQLVFQPIIIIGPPGSETLAVATAP